LLSTDAVILRATVEASKEQKQMGNVKQTQIRINTSELILIKKMNGTAIADCPQCGARVEMVTPEQAVTMTKIRSRAIYAMVERDQIHFIETNQGFLLICLNSLQKQVRFPGSGND